MKLLNDIIISIIDITVKKFQEKTYLIKIMKILIYKIYQKMKV